MHKHTASPKEGIWKRIPSNGDGICEISRPLPVRLFSFAYSYNCPLDSLFTVTLGMCSFPLLLDEEHSRGKRRGIDSVEQITMFPEQHLLSLKLSQPAGRSRDMGIRMHPFDR